MRKEVISEAAGHAAAKGIAWLDVDSKAKVQVSSEDKEFPVEGALVEGDTRGWRAATPGKQTIRLVFDKPQNISRVWLVMEDPEKWRTQEFVLRWSPDNGGTFKEIVRQQWNFSPSSIRETEDYTVQVSGATILELAILPDQNGGDARASVLQWRIA
jgi:hypothetical protein